MEVLGWSEITQQQEAVITELLAGMKYLSVTEAVENAAIRLCRTRKAKLPDAIIAATAQVNELELLTLDDELRKAIID
jgi:predicted nucleic acid-binding protein